jgi:hypothetical protein
MYLQTVQKEVGEVEVTQMVDPGVDLKIVRCHPVLFHRNPDASVADQHVQPAIIRVSTRDIPYRDNP